MGVGGPMCKQQRLSFFKMFSEHTMLRRHKYSIGEATLKTFQMIPHFTQDRAACKAKEKAVSSSERELATNCQQGVTIPLSIPHTLIHYYIYRFET